MGTIICNLLFSASVNREVQKCPAGWLNPGDQYDITPVPDRTISSITVLWEDGENNAYGTLYIDGVSYGTVSISDLPSEYTWAGLHYDTTEFTRVWIEITGGCANILGWEVEYMEAWFPFAPGASIPLPEFPPEINRITFEARTDPGTTSQITLFIDGDPFISDTITQYPKNENFDIGFTVPINLVSLTNTGGSTIYIRNLTTSD